MSEMAGFGECDDADEEDEALEYHLSCYPSRWAEERSRLTRQELARSASGRELLRVFAGDITQHEVAALTHVDALAASLGADDPVRSEEARRALTSLVYSAATRAAEPIGSTERCAGALSVVDFWMEAARSTTRQRLQALIPTRVLQFIRPLWGKSSIAMSAVAAIAIASNHLLVALLVIGARVALAVAVPTACLPADDVGTSAFKPATRSCVANHLADNVLLLACGYLLLSSGHPMLGWAMGLVPLIAFSATLFRVACLQEGFWILRSNLERGARVGGMLAAITMAYVFSSVLWLLIAGATALGYALQEIWMTERRLEQGCEERSGQDALSNRAQAITTCLRVVGGSHHVPDTPDAETVA